MTLKKNTGSGRWRENKLVDERELKGKKPDYHRIRNPNATMVVLKHWPITGLFWRCQLINTEINRYNKVIRETDECGKNTYSMITGYLVLCTKGY